ncbi:MAG: hypothetical protein EOP35_07265 [Rubrivivax sp.]|nr:MAG: hypothetical protein EOP35_07265 [Rubrivivax sp.]
MHRLLTLLAVSALALLLAGCDLRQRFGNAEERINAAAPLGIDIRQARERLVEQSGEAKAGRDSFDSAWSARMRARAMSCSPDFTPTWRHSSDEVRAAVNNKACFADFDRKLTRWIGAQRVRLLLAQPAAAVGDIPPSITLSGRLAGTPSAQSSLVAVTAADGLELVALDGGRTVFKERGAGGGANLAPNGRLFAQTVSGALRIRAVEGGETLLELPDVRSMRWLSPWFIGLGSAGNKPSSLFSLNSGEEVAVVVNTMGSHSNEALLPVPGQGNRFNLLTFPGLYQLEAQEQGGKFSITAVAEKPGVDPRLMGLTSGQGQLSPDGKQWVLAGDRKLVRLDLTTLEVQEHSFMPILVQAAAPTAKPDQFVLDLLVPSDTVAGSSHNGNYLFDATAGTLARVEGAAARRSIGYVPAIRRLMQQSLPTLWLSEQLDTTAPRPVADVVAAALEEANLHKLAQVEAEQQRVAASPALQTGSPLLASVQNAQVEGVGIYEAREKIAQPGQSRSTGRVVVNVRRSPRPLVLVLCSYEPVQWQLRLEPGAKLGAVLVSGYYDSTVVGAGDARVLKIGSIHAYKQEGPEFAALQREVSRWAGRPISLFQSGYSGVSFSVGGS